MTNDKLKYWRTTKDYENCKHPKGIIDFNRVMVQLNVNLNNQFDLHLLGCSRVFTFKAPNDIELYKWTKQIEEVMLNSKGYNEALQIKESDFRIDFWRFEHIDEDKFLEQAQTGDILLFRGNHLGAKLSRGLTSGIVDHAAMIVRMANKFHGQDIFFLESVMVRGVCFTSWANFKQNNKMYDEILYRRLECKRDDAFY